jgi:hypothetical protein
MKAILSIFIATLASFLLAVFLPWWSIIIAPFAIGYYLSFKTLSHLGLGFISIFLLWGIQGFMAFQTNAADLVPMIGKLFKGLSPLALILLASIIGGLYGGLAQLTGHLLKKSFK